MLSVRERLAFDHQLFGEGFVSSISKTFLRQNHNVLSTGFRCVRQLFRSFAPYLALRASAVLFSRLSVNQ